MREQTIVPVYPCACPQLYNSAAGWNYNPCYVYVRTFDPFDPYYGDPFLDEPFCSSYKSFNDPYWYYYNAYFYPYQPYYPFYPYSSYYGYYYHDNDDHCHRQQKSFWRIRKHRADEGKIAGITGSMNGAKKEKTRWE